MNKTNNKTLLCRNMINNNLCNYGHKCVYAHNLDEQKPLKYRKIIYDIIDKKMDGKEYFKYLDLKKESELLKTLIELTKLCDKCNSNKCTGGLNCKYGSPNLKYLICKKDLEYGNCYDKSCKKVHMSDYGLISLYNNKSNEQNNSSDFDDELNNSDNESENSSITDECYISIFA